MSDAPQTYIITQEKRDRLTQEIGNLCKDRVLLHQSLREQRTQESTATEELFLELLEVSDALESLLDSIANNSHSSPEFLQRLSRSIEVARRKFLGVLEKRQVLPIEMEGTQPDFNFCRVVDREVRADLADQTITKIVRRGFRLSEKVLRPSEVITSKLN